MVGLFSYRFGVCTFEITRYHRLYQYVLSRSVTGTESILATLMSETRPVGLPDYNNPPLEELVLGVQFQAPAGYTEINAGDVWKLFKEEFPTVRERPSLQPQFETFGLASSPQLKLQLITDAQHSRFWFISKDEAEVIQFQSDRLVHNWRRSSGVGDGEDRKYPRFEKLRNRFFSELSELQTYFDELERQKLSINQCEISYQNKMYIDVSEGNEEIFQFVKLQGQSVERIKINFSRQLNDENDNPKGRLYVDLNALPRASKKPTLFQVNFNLTVRGAPSDTDIDAAIEFISWGRIAIVNAFTNLTTEYAHDTWKRVT